MGSELYIWASTRDLELVLTGSMLIRAVTICHKHIAIYCDMWQAYCNNTTIYCAIMSRYILGENEKNIDMRLNF